MIYCSLQVLNSNNLFWSKKWNTCSKKGDYLTKFNTCKDITWRILKESKLFMKLSISVHFWVLRLMPVTVAFCVSFSGQDRCWRSVVHQNCVVFQLELLKHRVQRFKLSEIWRPDHKMKNKTTLLPRANANCKNEWCIISLWITYFLSKST